MGDSPDLSGGPPPVPPALVEYLERVYPDRFPTFSESAGLDLAHVHRQAGRLDVVRWLRQQLDRQATARPARHQLPPSPF